jgi:hypothetical protein
MQHHPLEDPALPISNRRFVEERVHLSGQAQMCPTSASRETSVNKFGPLMGAAPVIRALSFSPVGRYRFLKGRHLSDRLLQCGTDFLPREGFWEYQKK